MKLNLLRWFAAFLLAVAFLGATGLIPEWGKWYSGNLAYRDQTEAFLRGRLAIHSTPSALGVDLAWHDGAVQQVWGLGVPFWRLPFEILAKAGGQSAFPDRLAFGASLMTLAYLLLRIVLVPARHEENAPPNYTHKPLRLAAAAVMFFFPPFLVLCYFRFDVYEEAVAYEYVFGIVLFLSLIAFARIPTKPKYLLTSALAGIAGFFRPTLAAYAFPTMALLLIVSRRAKFKMWQSVLGFCLFLLGGLLLFITNEVRFGSGLEFGHSINFNSFPIWFYDRIYNPFQKEPLFAAARELFGSIFLRPTLNGFRWDQQHLFWGQSSTPRWRHFYGTCFDISFVPLIAGCWVLWLICGKRQTGRRLALPIEARLAGPWSFASAAMLALFYLRAPVMSNRYVFDFAPAFSIAITGLLFGLGAVTQNLLVKQGLWTAVTVSGLALWFGLEFYCARTTSGPSSTLDKAGLREAEKREFASQAVLPDHYEAGTDLSLYGIPFNGSGWSPDGRMATMSVLFVKDLEKLRVVVTPAVPDKPVEVANLSAKVGLEWLTIDSVHQNGEQYALTFKPPERRGYRQGIQVVFLAYVDKNNLRAAQSPLRLLQVEWK